MKKNLFILFVFLFLPAFVLTQGNIEINTASLAQLDELVGIGPVLAQRIVDARPFSSVDDLLRVKGIGEKTLQKIKDQGLAYVSGGTKPPTQLENQAQNTNPDNNQISSTQNPTPITYPDGVFINEVMPAPDGPDELNEWFELQNSNNFDVDLSGWKIKDIEGITTTYLLPQNQKILAGAYLVLKKPDTRITLNNDKDGLNLIQPSEKIADSVSFQKALRNQSYNKTDAGWQWSSTLTPGGKNNIAQALAEEKTLPETPKTANTSNKVLTAAVTNPSKVQEEKLNQIDNQLDPLIIFWVALGLTLVSGGVILFLRFKRTQ